MMAAVASPKVSRLPTVSTPQPLATAARVPRQKAYLNKGELAAHMNVSERSAHTISREDWFPKPIVMAPRVYRWSLVEVDEALRTRAPRATGDAEPEALQASREARRVGVIVRNGRITKVTTA